MPRDFANLSKRQQKRIIIKDFETARSSCVNDSVSVGKSQIASEEQNNLAPENTTICTECILPNEKSLEESDHGSQNDNLYGTTTNYSNSRSGIDFFSDELRKCFLGHNLSHSCVNDLLRVLRTFGHPDLPSDARTFLRTPRSADSNIVNLGGGQYLHFGLANNIRKFILKYTVQCDLGYLLKLNVAVDGLPLAKSSGSQFWPIMGDIVIQNIYTTPFIVGCFHGYSKPADSGEFLSAFVNEFRHLEQTGFELNGKHFNVQLNCFIADTPARAFILNIKGHSGYFGCSKCVCEGDYVEGRVVLLENSSSLRTNKSFRLKQQPEHHHGPSILETLNIDMVQQFPLDYMHLVLLGVTKRILCLWLRGNKSVRLTKVQIDNLDEAFLLTKGYIISDFSRKPRSIQHIDRWKATEFRLFLLYVGPVILDGVLSRKMYCHFLTLSVAIRILCSHTKLHYDYAQELLIYFVKKFSYFFGEENMSFNVPNLIHLTNDAKYRFTRFI